MALLAELPRNGDYVLLDGRGNEHCVRVPTRIGIGCASTPSKPDSGYTI